MGRWAGCNIVNFFKFSPQINPCKTEKCTCSRQHSSDLTTSRHVSHMQKWLYIGFGVLQKVVLFFDDLCTEPLYLPLLAWVKCLREKIYTLLKNNVTHILNCREIYCEIYILYTSARINIMVSLCVHAIRRWRNVFVVPM